MKWHMLPYTLLLLLFLAACSPGGSEPAANTAGTAGDEAAQVENDDGAVIGALTPVPAADPTTEPADSPTATAVPPTSLPPTAVPPATEPASEPMTEPVIVFYQSGGIMGLTDEWRFFPSGLLVDKNGEKWQLPPARMEALLATARAADFFTLADSYMPENTCCDFFTYTVEFHDGGASHTVTTMDNATNAPPGLTDLIWSIQDILRTIREGGSLDPEQ